MENKNIIEVLAVIPMGFFWGLKKGLAIITCWALKSRTFYTIVSLCLEKSGKQIMNIENLEKKLETITKNSTELKEGNIEIEEKLETITKNSTELKEGNIEIEEKLETITKNSTELKEGNQELEERLEAIAKNNREDNRELKKGNIELEERLVDAIAKNSIELKEFLRQLLKNQNNKN